MLVQAAYCSLYYYNFIGRPGTKRVVKAVLVSLFVFFFWMSLSSVAIGFYIRNGFLGDGEMSKYIAGKMVSAVK